MKSLFQLGIALMMLAVSICSCDFISKKAKEEVRDELKEVLTDLSRELPMEVIEGHMTITDINLEGDFMVCTCEVSETIAMSMSETMASSDENLARVLEGMDEDAVETFIDNGVGIKYVYYSQGTGDYLMEVSMSATKMKSLRNKMNAHTLQPNTLLDQMKAEVANMEFPMLIEEGLWLENAYVQGHDVCYVYSMEYEVDASTITQEDLQSTKAGCIEGLRDQPLISSRKNELKKERINFVYIYKDNRGVEFARVKIRPNELF